MKFLVIVLGPPLVALFVFLVGEVVMHLWNWLLPPLFGWHEITFWQAFGLLALCRILFGGFGKGGGSSSSRSPSREDRERFQQRMCERWGMGKPAPESGSVGESGESKAL